MSPNSFKQLAFWYEKLTLKFKKINIFFRILILNLKFLKNIKLLNKDTLFERNNRF